jgi:hypothetical protein
MGKAGSVPRAFWVERAHASVLVIALFAITNFSAVHSSVPSA